MRVRFSESCSPLIVHLGPELHTSKPADDEIGPRELEECCTDDSSRRVVLPQSSSGASVEDLVCY